MEPSIEALLIARPTKSKSLYCQMVGRGVRKFRSKEICYLYEVADNYHKICSFNTLANKEPEFNLDYEKGERLTRLHEKIKHLNVEDIILTKERFNVFEFNSLDQNIFDLHATSTQLNHLRKTGIPFMMPISFKEAAFLIWKNNKMREYAINM